MILEEGLYGMDREHVLRERDEEGDTALHLAASAGLSSCVELLMDYKADLYVTNKKEKTAADCAAECKLSSIATLLETRMVFSVCGLTFTFSSISLLFGASAVGMVWCGLVVLDNGVMCRRLAFPGFSLYNSRWCPLAQLSFVPFPKNTCKREVWIHTLN